VRSCLIVVLKIREGQMKLFNRNLDAFEKKTKQQKRQDKTVVFGVKFL